MKTLKTSLFLVLPLLLGACGAQLVDFPGEGGAEDGAIGDAAAEDADAAHLDAAP